MPMKKEDEPRGEHSSGKSEAAALLRLQLDSVPIVSPIAEVSELDENRVRITVPRRYKWWGKPLKLIFRLKNKLNVELDETGTEVFLLCDGSRTLEQIIDILMDKYRLSFFESRALALSFMQMLMKKDIMYVRPAVPAPPGASDKRIP